MLRCGNKYWNLQYFPVKLLYEESGIIMKPSETILVAVLTILIVLAGSSIVIDANNNDVAITDNAKGFSQL